MKAFRHMMAASAVALGMVAGAAPAAAKFAPIEMAISFASHGGIHTWRALDSDTLYVQDNRGDWYRAELAGSLPALSMADAIGFEASPGGRFDRWSAVIVEGRRYPLRALVASGPPVPRKLLKTLDGKAD